MKLLDRILLVVSCALTLGIIFMGTAPAADIYTKANPAQQPAAYVPWSWTGLYLGGFIGYGKKSEGFNITGNDSDTSKVLSKNYFPSSVPVEVDGPMVGILAKYQWQFAERFTLGAAVDWSYSGMSGNSPAGGNLLGVSITEKIRNYGTVRGELGFLVTDWARLYGTVGYGWAQVKTDVASSGLACGSGGFVCPTGSSDDYRGGLVLGGGLEARIARGWTVELTYLYNDFGTQRTLVSGSRKVYKSCDCDNPYVQQGYSVNLDQDIRFQVVRVGLNYRF